MKFSNHIKSYEIQPSSYVKSLLDNQKIGNLSDVDLFKKFSNLLGYEEYDRVHKQFLKNEKPNNFLELFYNIGREEKQIQKELKKIAEDAVREIFDVPDYINFESELKDPSNNFNNELKEYEISVDITEEIKKEINKRILLNALIHGAAIYSWKTTHYIIKEKIDILNPNLISYYDKFTSLVSMYLFQITSELPLIANGISSVKNEEKTNEEETNEEEITISAKANSLPVLLHEMVKGVVSLWMQHGIPNHLSEEEIMTIYSEADKYEDEYYHYLISPSLWENFLKATNVYPYELAPIVSKLAQLSPEKLEEVLSACIENKNYAHSLMKTYKIL